MAFDDLRAFAKAQLERLEKHKILNQANSYNDLKEVLDTIKAQYSAGSITDREAAALNKFVEAHFRYFEENPYNINWSAQEKAEYDSKQAAYRMAAFEKALKG